MDKAKIVKNTQPTIKLSDIDVVPIFVGILVILVTLGKGVDAQTNAGIAKNA